MEAGKHHPARGTESEHTNPALGEPRVKGRSWDSWVSWCWSSGTEVAFQETILEVFAAGLGQGGDLGPQSSLWQWNREGGGRLETVQEELTLSSN